MEILMTKLDEKFREHKRDSVKAIADANGKIQEYVNAKLTALNERITTAPFKSHESDAKRQRQAPDPYGPGMGPPCVMHAQKRCNNGNSCHYLHGDGAGQVICSRNPCKVKDCKFVHNQ